MGIYESYHPYIIEIISLKGVAYTAKCRFYTSVFTTLGFMYTEYHPTFLFYRIIRDRDYKNPYQVMINDEEPDHKQVFSDIIVFDDWMSVNLPMRKLICY